MNRTLGTCYYPEHWPEDWWPDDAARMADLGLTWVRIGEFAWSRMEPKPREYDFGWLDRAIDTLNAAGLKVVLGTPSATPPRWMLDRFPDMLAVDAQGLLRKFGSRRHYCFSHAGYRAAAADMARRLAERYGNRVAAWQTDNEYGCHDTTISYSAHARDAFRDWCAQRYQSPDALNRAWGNVFWSMEYAEFNEIDLPNLTVTEPNPAHVMAFRRFTSDQVVAWNQAQVAAIRAHSDAPISHNYMGLVTDFDHYKVATDMEIATWDSYPMGFLEDRVPADDTHRRAYMRQGDPDFQAFHHDLYRACGKGRWWVMEQQPGPVNWAPSNPAPLPGMVRLWSWEAFAHGAECVSWFRWRQAPFAQEQQHAGLLRADSSAAPGYSEAQQVAQEIAARADVATATSPIALVFDYESQWAWETQPQGQGFSHFGLAFDLYRALRKLGQSIDIIPPTTTDLSPYRMVVVPGLLSMTDDFRKALSTFTGSVLTGPRTDLKTEELSAKVPLGPYVPGITLKVTEVETLRPDVTLDGRVQLWFEHIETDDDVMMECEGRPLLIRNRRRWHLAGWPTPDCALTIMDRVLRGAGLTPVPLPEGVRLRTHGTERFVFNYADAPRLFEGKTLAPADVSFT